MPARYGGFETAVEEIGRRLVDAGHEVFVYCRTDHGLPEHLGMKRIELPAVKHRSAETLSHSAISVVHSVAKLKPDVMFLFNAANSPMLPLLRAASIPTVLHMDGLEWKRSKWGQTGQRYYRMAEAYGVRAASALISDAQAIADYYREAYDAPSYVIRYGAETVRAPEAPVRALGLEPHKFTLIVARVEPENNVDIALAGAIKARTDEPIVFVGKNPYETAYTRKIDALAASDSRVRALGSVWDQELLDSLYTHARLYLHGHSVGGTNPSLLRAMGAGSAVSAYDVSFNREVLRRSDHWWTDAAGVAHAIENTTAERATQLGLRNRNRIETTYRWDDVAAQYEQLAYDVAGHPRVTLSAFRTTRIAHPASLARVNAARAARDGVDARSA